MKILRNKFIYFSLIFFTAIFSFQLINQKTNISPKPKNGELLYQQTLKVLEKKFYIKDKIDFSHYRKKYSSKIRRGGNAHKYIRIVIKKLGDPYTRFLTKDQFTEEQEAMKSKLIGIGIKLAFGTPKVIGIINDSPAYEAGIKINDYIESIDNKGTKGLDTFELYKALSGEQGSPVDLEIKRGNKSFTKSLIRKNLNIKPIVAKQLKNNIGLIKVTSFFPQSTSKIFKDSLLDLMCSNGLILDLRNNSGGLLKNAVNIADFFLDKGKIVSTIHRYGDLTEKANPTKIYNGNLVIIVNEYTASASEVLASALKDNKRAKIIGNKTFGKGLVQEVIPFTNGAGMHVTIGAYYTPNGKNIHRKGIIPDIIEKDKDLQFKKAKDLITS